MRNPQGITLLGVISKYILEKDNSYKPFLFFSNMLNSRPRSVIDKNNLSSAKSLTTYDLYKRPGYAFEVNDLVKFKLLRGYELIMYGVGYESSKRGIVEKSKNKNLNKTITGTIIDYEPGKLSDLEIELIRRDGCEIKLKLSQCKNLKIMS